MKVCEKCGRIAYYNCAECDKPFCDSHVEKCTKCGRWFCPDHVRLIGGKYVCRKCLSSRVSAYVGVVAVLIFLVCGALYVLPGMRSGLVMTGGDLVLGPWVDAESVTMVLRLNYEYKSEASFEITDVSFDDDTIRSLFKMENLKRSEGDEDSYFEIVFPKISSELAQKIRDDAGRVYWKKGYRGKQETAEFSFKIGEIPRFPVLMGDPTPSSVEVKEGEVVAIAVEVEILEDLPEGISLTLAVEAGSRNVKIVSESQWQLKKGKNECEFSFRFPVEDRTVLKFKVLADDNMTQWGEKQVPVTVSRRDRIWLSEITLVNQDGNPWNAENGEYVMEFSTEEEQRPSYGLSFSAEGTGEQIVIFVYFDCSFNDVTLRKPQNIGMFQLDGQFGEHDNGLFLVISDLKEKKPFWLEFRNPTFDQTEDFQQTVGVALIRIADATSLSCSTIANSMGRSFSESTYEFMHDSMQNMSCSPEQNGYESCSKAFVVKFKKKDKPASPSPTPTGEPDREGSSQNALLAYAFLFIFLLIYLLIRRGGIL